MYQLYSIFDKKGAIFSNPFYCRNVSEALRTLSIGMSEGKAMFALFPGDFALYLLGTFDPLSGFIMPTVSGQPQFSEELANLVLPPKGGVS